LTCAYTTPLIRPVFLTAFLSENEVGRGWSGEERKRGEGPDPHGRNKRFNICNDGRDKERHWRLDHLHSYMCGGAKRAVRVRYVADWMSVNYLDRPSRNNQEHTKQSEEKPPRALHIRSWPRAQHDESNISQYVTSK